MAEQPVSLGAKADAPLEREIDESVYPELVVVRAVHSLAPTLAGVVSRPRDGVLRVTLRFCSGVVENSEHVWARLEILLNDFLLRRTLELETRELRHLIISQAFSRSNLQFPELDTANPEQDPLRLSQPDPETGRRHD